MNSQLDRRKKEASKQKGQCGDPVAFWDVLLLPDSYFFGPPRSADKHGIYKSRAEMGGGLQVLGNPFP